MPVKKLFDAVIFGLGASAGQRAYQEIERKVETLLDEEKVEETPAERVKRVKREKAERDKAMKEAKKARAKEEAAVDKELEALKKRIK